MKKIIQKWSILLMILSAYSGYGQQINRGEYFIDTDPGVGNGTAITITSADSVDISSSINLTGISPGFHTLHVRVRYNNTGIREWSLFEGRRFYINPSSNGSASPQVVAAERFIDTDPGLGNGTPINTGAAADSITKSATLSTNGLAPGFHHLFVRVKDASGKWSLYEPRVFYIIPPSTANQAQIASAEYFFDVDPGLGNGTSVATGANADSINISSTASIAGLTEGFHHFFVRVKSTDGIWSLYAARNFYINASGTIVSAQISNAEYFYDTDPGEGNGTAVTPSFSPADSVNISANTVVTGLTPGYHYMFVRAQDQDGKWSLPVSDTLWIGTAGINELVANTNVNLSPNPVQSSCIISYHGVQPNSYLKLCDLSGRVVYNESLQGQEGKQFITLPELANGVYYWTTYSGYKNSAKGKIIVAH